MNEVVTVVVTTPKGSRVEYALDTTGLLRVVRILVAAPHFPANTLVAVHVDDPVVADIEDIAELPAHLRAELAKFIATTYAPP